MSVHIEKKRRKVVRFRKRFLKLELATANQGSTTHHTVTEPVKVHTHTHIHSFSHAHKYTQLPITTTVLSEEPTWPRLRPNLLFFHTNAYNQRLQWKIRRSASCLWQCVHFFFFFLCFHTYYCMDCLLFFFFFCYTETTEWIHVDEPRPGLTGVEPTARVQIKGVSFVQHLPPRNCYEWMLRQDV